MYTTVQQNNYKLDAITVQCKEIKTFRIIYDTRNTKKMAERKYSNASKAKEHKKTCTATESCTQYRKYLDS